MKISLTRTIINSISLFMVITVVLFLAASCNADKSSPAASSSATPVGSPAKSSSITPEGSTAPNPATSVNSSTVMTEVSASPTPFAGTRIELIMNNHPQKTGDVFKVEVEISCNTAARGIQWKLSFNPKVMQLQDIDEGNFFKGWANSHNGTTVVFPQPVIDNTKGQVSDMGIAVMSSTTGGVTGQGILCTYNFIALSSSIEMPVISDMLLYNVNGKIFPCTAAAK